MFEASALQRLHVGPIDLQLSAGTCTSLTGPSGAGKSVLLRMLADLDPHGGRMRLDGRDSTDMPAPAWRRAVGYLPAVSGWWLPRVDAHFAPGDDLPARFAAVGIAPEAATWPVDRLSTGERQRLSLLRALHDDTRVLLLDEPTSGLDGESVALVEALLAGRRARGLAILWVTHDRAQARRVASRHLALRAGQSVPADLDVA